jgi:pimeloyl-ACP methyl ester carboxylesterase
MEPMSVAALAQRSVVSKDGTRVGYLQQGAGPGIVLVQGAMGTANHYSELATALSKNFTVYSADRRGRGRSPKPYDTSHDIARDIEDIDAILTANDAHYVFGLSSGAIITLQAAMTLPSITKAAAYEPPFYARGISHDGIRRLGREIEQGQYGAALIDALLTAQTAPAVLRVLPRPLARALGFLVLRIEALVASGPDTLRAMLPGIRYDFHVVGSMDGQIETLRALHRPVLLLTGTKSQAFLREAIDRLQSVLLNEQRVDLDGLTHSGPWNKNRGGNPALVAQALETFFLHT